MMYVTESIILIAVSIKATKSRKALLDCLEKDRQDATISKKGNG